MIIIQMRLKLYKYLQASCVVRMKVCVYRPNETMIDRRNRTKRRSIVKIIQFHILFGVIEAFAFIV